MIKQQEKNLAADSEAIKAQQLNPLTLNLQTRNDTFKRVIKNAPADETASINY